MKTKTPSGHRTPITRRKLNLRFNKVAIIALLVLIVAMTAGCTKAKTCPLTVSQTEGLLIKRVEPSYFIVPVNDEISVYMDVQNRGNFVARSISATLWAHTGFALSGTITPFEGTGYDAYKRNKGQLDPGKVYPNGMITSRQLEPPRLDICSEGDVQTFHWSIKAGCDPVETILAVYLDYDYESSGYAKIPLASRDQYERTQGELKAKGENFPSAGPMQVKIEAVQAEPVLISKETKVFSVRVLFNNVGPGLLGPKGMGDAGTVNLTLSGPCKFSSRNIDAVCGDNEGTVDCKRKHQLLLDDYPKTFVWNNQTVIMRSGDQEAMKLAYIEYDCSTGDCDAEIDNFIEDICRIEVNANYHYQTVESPSKTMGVYGSPSQIEYCLSNAGQAN